MALKIFFVNSHGCAGSPKSVIIRIIHELGVRGFIRFIRETIAGPWLDPLLVRERLAAPFQLRLI
jgi:hypothetical protein